MIRTVTWVSDVKLSCEATADVILCLATFTIPAQLTDTYELSCSCEYAYTFDYEDEDLPSDYIDLYGPLDSTSIENVFCEDCRTDWTRELVDKSFALTFTPGSEDTGDEITVSGGGPLAIVGGDGISLDYIQETSTDLPTIIINSVPSTDSDNQIILGSDNKPYVAPALYSASGWYPAPGVWTYASANSVNIPAGGLLLYALGDKIRLIQGATTKYFYVVSVADTVLGLQAGSDYTVANSDITSADFSKAVSPVGFPHQFNFSSTITGFSVLPIQTRRFSVSGTKVRIDVYASGTSGTSNATTFYMTVPIAANTSSGMKFFSGGHQCLDNGVYMKNCLAELLPGSTNIILNPDGAAVPWTASGDKSASFNLDYFM